MAFKATDVPCTCGLPGTVANVVVVEINVGAGYMTDHVPAVLFTWMSAESYWVVWLTPVAAVLSRST